MVSPYGSSILLVTDDDDDNEYEQNPLSFNSYSTMMNGNLPCKKRKITNSSIQINPSTVYSSKQHPNESYRYQIPVMNSLNNRELDLRYVNRNDHMVDESESNSFFAFNWSNEMPSSSRINSHAGPLVPRTPTIPSSSSLNTVKHNLYQSNSYISMPTTSHFDDNYIQSPREMSHISLPSSVSSLLKLPLPTPTSAVVRPRAQRFQPGQKIQNPYVPTSSTTTPVTKPDISSTLHTPLVNQKSTIEARRQALNGVNTLSAFYDSNLYRCNFCKYNTNLSSNLLQHLFNHIFFCRQCSYFTYSHYSLYQHLLEKHSNIHQDNSDSKNPDLIYLTRCIDGTFALSMDSSAILKKNEPIPISTEIKTNNNHTNKTASPKPTTVKRKVQEDNDIILLSEKRRLNDNKAKTLERSLSDMKEKQKSTYVLMKHRRCYSIHPHICLHSFTLEYNICREHTIRHMCYKRNLLRKRNPKSKSNILRLIDEVAQCLKTVVNIIVNTEENRNTPELICALPQIVINRIFYNNEITNISAMLKLNNKYDKSVEFNEQMNCEHAIRTNTQHVFMLSSLEMSKNEQTVFTSLHTSVTNSDCLSMQSDFNKKSLSYDNTHCFFKGSNDDQTRSKISITNAIKPSSSNKVDLVKSSSRKSDKYNGTVKYSAANSCSTTSNVIVLD